MRKRTRGYGAVVGLAALALVVAACGGSSTAKPGTSPTGTTAGFQGLNPGTGTPKKGGTLNMLGQGDVDFMDYNISYYSIGFLAQRMWQRDLYAYAAIPGKTTLPSPDLATAAPTITNGSKTYSVTIRTGAMWDTSPPRQVTAADALLGLKRSCNPVQPFGGLPDFETLIVGYQAFCASFAKLGLTNALIIDGPAPEANFQLAARNIPQIDVLPVQGINVYDILRREKLVLTKAAIDALEARFK